MAHPYDARLLTRRSALRLLLGGGAVAAAGCAGGKLLGYTTQPNYDPEIRTVYVPIFKTRALETTPHRGMEFTLTRLVVDAIESKTPMKVVSDPDGADSELQGTIVTIGKALLNRTPFNEAREVQLVVTVEVVWFDLRPGREGRVLTNPRRRELAPAEAIVPFDPENPPPPRSPDQPVPVILTDAGRAFPELGETSTSAMHMVLKRLATRIVSAMEEPW